MQFDFIKVLSSDLKVWAFLDSLTTEDNILFIFAVASLLKTQCRSPESNRDGVATAGF